MASRTMPGGHSPLILALDTATPRLSIALFDVDGRTCVVERSYGPPSSHSDLLPGVVADLLAEAGLTPRHLGGVAVGLGPGSFTGLRVGLSTAKGFCYALRIPIAGASSLLAMAHAASPFAAPGAMLVPCLHARRDEVYAGFYRAGSLEAVAEEEAPSPAALESRLRVGGASAMLFGTGRSANAATFDRIAPAPAGVPETPSASSIATLSGPWGGFDVARVFALEPHYIRPSEAEAKSPDGLAMSEKQKRAVRGALPKRR